MREVAEHRLCPKCGLPVPESVPEGLCARCLLEERLAETQTAETLTANLKPGTRSALPNFGRYHAIGMLGEGGMGIVYLAEQREPIRRRVALKVLKYGEAGSSVAARFESESQALALMDHPNIAQVYDAGVTPAGRPYFALEYVPGIPITDYCDRNLLGVRERLILFQQTCLAVQHAHQKGVIHRDLKPSNILVMLQDNKPVPKVIDFGVAKAVNQRLVERTLFTEVGMVIGTPEYMSPEQAEHTALDVDSTTDIYSLGVLLYELLVGALPFDSKVLRKMGYSEIQRIIREQEPPKPSARLSAMGEMAAEVARRRSSDVRSLVRVLKDDLEWITMKALEKDRTRRYATASEFAADIGRHIANEPVVAGPPGILYQSQKFVRRHKGVVAAGGAIALALLVGAVVSFLLYLRAVQEQRAAELASYAANLNAADLQLRAGLAGDARARLANAAPALRGWEWRHMMSRTDSSRATIYSAQELYGPERHAWFPEIAFSEDGKQLFCARDAFLRSWDITTKRLVTDMSGLGRVLAIGSHGKTVLVGPYLRFAADTPREGFVLRLYDVNTRRVLAELRGMTADPGAAAISEDGMLVAATEDIGGLGGDWRKHAAPVFIWNTQTAAIIAHVEYHPGWLMTLRFSPDGHYLASTFSGDNIVHLWDVRRRMQAAQLRHAEAITSFSSDARLLASGSFSEGTIRIWNPATGRLVRSWDANPTGGTRALAFSPDGSLLATAAYPEGALRVWSALTGRLQAEFNVTVKLEAVAFHPSAPRLYAAGYGIIKEFDLDRREALDEATAAVTAVASSPDGKYIAVGSQDGVLRIYAAALGSLTHSFIAHAGAITAVSFSPDSGLVGSCSVDKAVKVWSVPDGRLIRTLTGHADRVTSIGFYPDGQRLASGAFDRTIRVWSIANTGPPSVISTTDPVCSVAINPDGQTMAAFLLAWGISIWNAETGQHAGVLDNRYRTFGNRVGMCNPLAFSQDGKLLVSPDPTQQLIAIWNYPKRRLERTVPVFHATEFISSLAVSPDSTRFAIGGYGSGSLNVWDLQRGTLLLNLSGHGARVTSITWTSDGTRLVSGSVDRTVRIWDSGSPHDYEAEVVVDKYSKPQLAEEVVQAIENDHTISAEVRRRAILIAVKRGNSAYVELAFDAEETGEAPNRSPSEYTQALRRITQVAKVAPWSGVNQELLGLLQYRCADYEKALVSEQRAMDIQKAQSQDAHAIRAMAFYRLHASAKALAELDSARKLAEFDPSNEFATPTLLREAESLLSRSK